MKKYGDIVTYVRNGVEVNALVLQSKIEVDETHKQGLTKAEIAAPKECLLLIYLDPASASSTIHKVSDTTATAFSVKPLVDGATSGWKEYISPFVAGSGTGRYNEAKGDYSQKEDPYGIAAEYTSQSAAVDLRGNTQAPAVALPTQAEADAIVAKAAAERKPFQVKLFDTPDAPGIPFATLEEALAEAETLRTEGKTVEIIDALTGEILYDPVAGEKPAGGNSAV